MLALAGVAFAVGAIVGANHADSASQSRRVALRRGLDARRLRGDVRRASTRASRRTTLAGEFAAAYRQALVTATATGLRVTGSAARRAGRHRRGAGRRAHAAVRHAGAQLHAADLPARRRRRTRVEWSRSLVFPGLLPGERLSRTTLATARGRRCWRGTGRCSRKARRAVSLGEQSRSSPLGEAASAVVGSGRPDPGAHAGSRSLAAGRARRRDRRRERLRARARRPAARDARRRAARPRARRKRGPGGCSPPRRRVLRRRVRTTISPSIQRAAVAALGGQLGGIVAMDPQRPDPRGRGDRASNGLQPPGSTFKMITLSGVLQAGIASPHTRLPVRHRRRRSTGSS